ncbi:lateral flagellar assembly protein FliH [Zobellella denitrificans]|uniref:Flagellar assembly protein FliH n=1 Tax=Zobellella denitrificans TaxID=347534 RepID=A0A231MU52_9GAMM|nr:FliH/SctL family protein [Zobellella denitrificans]ATG74973.1 lateral flagellar assembly protein FliH [Zobellella denitrificans]OXS13742.1 lateral flagellar assembly protein FliH [Zobellella denitrificans]
MKGPSGSKWPAGGYRRYRFPSLYGEAEVRETAEQDEERFRQGFEQGYEQGLEQGRQAGYEAGAESGRQAGFEQGRQQGLAQLKELQRTLAEELRQWQTGAEQQWQQLSLSALRQQRQQICELVEEVSRRVIRTELTLNPQQVLAIVEEALKGIDPRVQELQLFLNPDDQQRLQALGITDCQGWTLHTDPALAPGDCRIETETLTLEALTEERLQKGIARVSQGLEAGDEPA